MEEEKREEGVKDPIKLFIVEAVGKYLTDNEWHKYKKNVTDGHK
jgi:hypothetical protein